jgi:hypothetical protein
MRWASETLSESCIWLWLWLSIAAVDAAQVYAYSVLLTALQCMSMCMPMLRAGQCLSMLADVVWALVRWWNAACWWLRNDQR